MYPSEGYTSSGDVVTELRLIVPGKPQPKQRARKGKGGRHYTPPETRAFESLVRLVGLQVTQRWKLATGKPWDKSGDFALGVTAYMPDRLKRDLSNVEKSIEDGLNGIAWHDDSQVKHRLEGGIKYDRERPRTEVVVRRRAE